MSDQRFAGKTVVITGAGGNFGRAGCIHFAKLGAKIAAMDNNDSALLETAEEVNAAVEGIHQAVIQTYNCDVTDPNSVEATVEKISKDFGDVHMLWNNAGYQGQIKPTLEYDPVDFARVMNINVTGMFVVLQSVAKKMAAQKRDGDNTVSHPFSIVNTASVAALRGTPAMVAYSSSKAAILAMTVSSAKDLAPHGIRVNAISPALIGPGFMWTRQNELHAASGSPYFSSDPEQVAQAKIGGVPMKRLGSIDEVIKSVAYLLSDDSSYTTGINLVVDGGLSAGLKA
ncbi:hypothetical protein ACHAXM_012077 [Skeletonema potamos]|jgi:NAD(P)-dependent dehydrogenase (short-subunit alcohol dehydrogenase family)